MNNKNQNEEFESTITPIYTQTENCYGRFTSKDGVISDFSIDEAFIEVDEEIKSKITLCFNGKAEVKIEIKTKDFFCLFSILAEKYLESLEKLNDQ
jgi:hypothetical protein